MVETLVDNEDKLPEYEFKKEVRRSGDDTIYGAFATGVYVFLDCLAQLQPENDDDIIRAAVMDLWLAIYPSSANLEKKTHKEIQKRLEPQLIEQAERNLTQKHMCYPMITKLLVNIVGLHETKSEAEGRARVTEIIHNLLREHFGNAAKLTEKRVRELLPEGYEYKKRKRSIVYQNRWMDSDNKSLRENRDTSSAKV